MISHLFIQHCKLISPHIETKWTQNIDMLIKYFNSV